MNEDEVKEMLALVLKNQSQLSIDVRAYHNNAIDMFGEFATLKTDNIQIKETLYGKLGEGGGLVEDVAILKRYGVAVSPELAKRIEAILFLFGVASICVILMMFIAGLVIVFGGLPWR